jgi:sulfite exporter TauE/SafE
MDTQLGVYGSLLLTGMVGSLGHCLGMCGPLVMMAGLEFRRSGGSVLWPHALYHLGRVAVYALLGLVAGSVGSAFGLGNALSSLAAMVSLLLGLAVSLLGLGYLGWLPVGRLGTQADWFGKAFGRVMQQGGPAGPLLLGALNGMLPCGLVYGALLAAASTGRAWGGALAMGLFGLGTVSALLALGLGALSLNAAVRQALTRISGAIMLLVGLQLGLRGLAAFGLVQHLHLGSLMIW